MGAAEELEAYLHREIPLSADMGATVASLGEGGLELSAPLEPNLNHKGTAFGGSIYSLAVLAAWGTVRGLLQAAGLSDCHVVIVEGNLAYLKPLSGPFRARCAGPSPEEAQAFRQGLERKGKARLSLSCEVRAEGAGEGEGPAAEFKGVFAASRGAAGKP